jgi:hypothetical protein
LLESSAAQIAQQLSDIVESDAQIFPYPKSGAEGSERRLLFKGIGFSVRIVSAPCNIGSFKHIFCNADLGRTVAAVAIGFDNNASGGEKIAPIVANLLEFGSVLATRFGAHAIAWTPASIVSEAGFFERAVKDYAQGGVFPALSVVDFDFSENNQTVHTCGLNWFSGQELQLRGEGFAQTEIMRRAVRIVHDIATNGRITVAGKIPDLDPLHLLSLEPDFDASVVVGTIQPVLDVVSV